MTCPPSNADHMTGTARKRVQLESFLFWDQSHGSEMTEPTKPNPPGAAGADEDLLCIDRVLAGDRRAFEPLVRRHERRVYRVTMAVLGNVEDAEEAMQDTFVKAFRHLDQFRREARFTTWLTRIAINEAIQKRQARKDFVSLDDSRDVPNGPKNSFRHDGMKPGGPTRRSSTESKNYARSSKPRFIRCQQCIGTPSCYATSKK